MEEKTSKSDILAGVVYLAFSLGILYWFSGRISFGRGPVLLVFFGHIFCTLFKDETLQALLLNWSGPLWAKRIYAAFQCAPIAWAWVLVFFVDESISDRLYLICVLFFFLVLVLYYLIFVLNDFLMTKDFDPDAGKLYPRISVAAIISFWIALIMAVIFEPTWLNMIDYILILTVILSFATTWSPHGSYRPLNFKCIGIAMVFLAWSMVSFEFSFADIFDPVVDVFKSNFPKT